MTTLSNSDIWDAVLEELWKRSRFVSYFYQAVHFVCDPKIPTLALAAISSRLLLLYNNECIESLSTDEKIGLLVHEMMHSILRHEHRALPGADTHLQNLAQDMVVNSYLIQNRNTFFSRKGGSITEIPVLTLPSGLPVVPQKYYDQTHNNDPSWEDVYRWLMSQSGDNYYSFDGSLDLAPGMQGLDINILSSTEKFESDGIPLTPLEKLKTNKSSDKIPSLEGLVFTRDDGAILPTGIHLFGSNRMVSDIDTAKKRVISLAVKDMSIKNERFFQDINGLITDVKKTDIASWISQIKSIVDFSSQSNEWTYTYGRFNKRFFAQGIYAPGRIFKEKEVITVVVDVSASMVMKPGEIESAFGVIEELLGKYRVYLLCIDEMLFIPQKNGGRISPGKNTMKPYRYTKGDWRQIQTGTSGTTFFVPLFNDYMLKHTEMLIVITDGFIYDLDRLKKYSPTLWVISGYREEPFVPPFGQVVRMGGAG